MVIIDLQGIHNNRIINLNRMTSVRGKKVLTYFMKFGPKPYPKNAAPVYAHTHTHTHTLKSKIMGGPLFWSCLI